MMIPITRKEKYINEIVGDGNTAPETPQTREEIFFADILGEVVAPSPITRAEKYLAKIANKHSGELPEPVTRIERFLARAAGMDVTIPTPITREEMFWANYALIVEKELSGIPPLTFNAVAGTLKNYRIYGNTVNGESVGDMTANLFDGELLPGFWDSTTTITNTSSTAFRSFKLLLPAGTYTFSVTTEINMVSLIVDGALMQNVGNNITSYTVTSTTDGYIGFSFRITGTTQTPWDDSPIMLNSGSTAIHYEPYGYRVPVTVTNGTDTQTTNIYLTEQLKIVGNEAEYIDYEEQKQHRVRKNLFQNTATSRTYAAGITLTVNNDKSVVVDGTSNTGAPIGIILGGNIIIGKGTYILSGCPQGGSNNTYKAICIFDDNGERKVITDSGNGATVVLDNDDAKIISNGFYISAQKCDDNTFYPMLRKADIEDNTYEPYIEDTELNVTLPALPTLSGTNTLTIGTEVQPSDVYIKYEGKR